MITTESLRDIDIRHLWHPYTDIEAFEKGPYTVIERAEGVYLYEQGGRPLLDGISSWWSTALGHGHPVVVEAIREQAGVLQQAILGNMSHPKAVELAHKLAEFTPEGLNHSYFAADGASATESALKMAIQYWWNQGIDGKCEFVCLQDGYHGDTLGAVGVGFVQRFHAPFTGAIRKAHVAPAPHAECDSGDRREEQAADAAFAELERIVEEHHPRLAGIILEPLCQGAAGIRIYPTSYLRQVRALCNRYELLLIADEIAVGFARTGAMFACEEADITPDIMCLGKALTAGYLPMSATIATTKVYDAFRNKGGRDCTFYDGHTYCGNPITSAAAIAALGLYTSESILDRVKPLETQLAEGFRTIGQHPAVAYQKSLGMIGMCAFGEDAGGMTFARRVWARAVELGLFIRPLGNVLYLWPPLVSTPEELRQMLTLFQQALEETGEE